MQHVRILGQHGLSLRYPPLRGRQLRRSLLTRRIGLRQAGLLFIQGRGCRVEGRFPRVEVLLGQKLGFKQLLGAIVVQLGMLQIGLGMVDQRLLRVQVFVGHFQAGFGRIGIRFSGTHLSCLRGDLRLRLDILDARDQLPSLYGLAFLYQNLGENTYGIGADVDVILRLNLARSGDQAGQILAHHLTGLDCHHAALTENRAGINADA